MTGPARMWTVEVGEYSDHRILCVCPTKQQAEAIAQARNGPDSYGDAYVRTLPIATDVEYVTTHNMSCEVWDDGRVTGRDDIAVRTELAVDMLWPERNRPVGWRWVRAPIHNNSGGRLDVWGTDLERVRRVFSDRRAQLIAEDVFRRRKEAGG